LSLLLFNKKKRRKQQVQKKKLFRKLLHLFVMLRAIFFLANLITRENINLSFIIFSSFSWQVVRGSKDESHLLRHIERVLFNIKHFPFQGSIHIQRNSTAKQIWIRFASSCHHCDVGSNMLSDLFKSLLHAWHFRLAFSLVAFCKESIVWKNYSMRNCFHLRKYFEGLVSSLLCYE
jgi:hypothetical protein